MQVSLLSENAQFVYLVHSALDRQDFHILESLNMTKSVMCYNGGGSGGGGWGVLF